MSHKTVVQTWGKSVAIKIPAALAKQTGLSVGTTVRFTPTARGLLLAAASKKPAIKLSNLLAQCKGPNPHRELMPDRSGKEIF